MLDSTHLSTTLLPHQPHADDLPRVATARRILAVALEKRNDARDFVEHAIRRAHEARINFNRAKIEAYDLRLAELALDGARQHLIARENAVQEYLRELEQELSGSQLRFSLAADILREAMNDAP